jgi:FAD synthetase
LSEMKKVLVFGTFDGLHLGHINFFEQAKKLGDKLTVVVGRDVTVKKVKGRSPKYNENDRLAAVRDSKLADEAMLGNLGDPYAIIKQIEPDIIALGYDQNSFTENLVYELKRAGIAAKIVRLNPFEPAQYHSSLVSP